MFKKKYFVYAVSMLIVAAGCNTQPKQDQAKAEMVPASEVEDVWKDYDTGKVLFEDKAPDTEGSKIYGPGELYSGTGTDGACHTL